jgi:PIF1-like helicase
MTGVAATLIQGETTHAALYLNQKRPIESEQIELWAPTKMVIIDEISFADGHDIETIDERLKALKQKHHSNYGSINIIFSGDFRQLEPVGSNKKPIYEQNIPQFRDWINCYIELSGIWRFRNDIPWGKLLTRMRNGEMLKADLNVINSHIDKNLTKTLPEAIRYATYYNRDRDAINAAIFARRVKQNFNSYGNANNFLLIFADNMLIRNTSKVYTEFKQPKLLWENNGEDDIKMARGTGRMDPVLKIYPGCRMMLPVNMSVSMGQANGTQALVQQVILKQSVVPSVTLFQGKIPVPCVFASQVDYILMRHLNTRIVENLFEVKPKKHSFTTELSTAPSFFSTKEKFAAKMRAIQIPIIHNDATTGHKLQGSGVDILFVHNWYYSANWCYVMLSRVKTMKGLYARHLLEEDLAKFAPKPPYTRMIEQLQDSKPIFYAEAQYTIISSATSIRQLSILN